jgi:hypothetical protein
MERWLKTRFIASGALTLLTVALAACGDEPAATSADDGGGDGGSSATTTADASTSTGEATPLPPGGAGQPAKAAYPEGPFGVGVGSVVHDFQFVGYTRPDVDKADLEIVSFSDFYNPTGTELFPEDGRAWAGLPKPKALAISVTAYWCPPCKDEWRNDIPPLQAELGPKGGMFLLLMSDGNDGGVPPVIAELNSWTSTFGVTAPSVLDPALDFQPIWEGDAYPQNILIRTSDMTIVDKVSGVPTPVYWNTMEKILDGVL